MKMVMRWELTFVSTQGHATDLSVLADSADSALEGGRAAYLAYLRTTALGREEIARLNERTPAVLKLAHVGGVWVEDGDA